MTLDANQLGVAKEKQAASRPPVCQMPARKNNYRLVRFVAGKGFDLNARITVDRLHPTAAATKSFVTFSPAASMAAHFSLISLAFLLDRIA